MQLTHDRLQILRVREPVLAVGSADVASRLPTPVESISLERGSGQRRASVDAHAGASEGTAVLDAAGAFRRYASYVAAIGMRILGRRDEIEDFVQDVFVSVHRNIGALREPAALKSWLSKLAVHEAMRRLKRRKLRALLGMGLAHDYSDIADASASPEERALLTRVFAALDQLPAADRVAWTLRHLEGETMERVAELCSCSLSTAKRRVASAEQALEQLGVGDD